MAKKRTKKKKKTAFSARLTKIERTILWLIVLIIVCFALSQIYTNRQTNTESAERIHTEEQYDSSPKYELSANLEIPKLSVSRSQQIIRHAGYTVSYNADYRIANWVAYELTGKEATSALVKRKNTFYKDPAIKGAAAISSDYSQSGFDRGHLAPAADMRWSAEAMKHSFYLSNICPQMPGLNRGPWATLEDQCREWAREKEHLYIAVGPVLTSGMKRIGENDISVPKKFYKVLCSSTGGVPEVLAFVFENKNYKREEPEEFICTVDAVEDLTGIDFFPSLPDEIENEIEARTSMQNWKFN